MQQRSYASLKEGWHRAFIALGSNQGDRVGEIEAACREMESQVDIRIVRTSNLWETEPMYVVDQAIFLNGACEIETRLEPIELLDRLQGIENKLGRHKIIDKGPRNIDLDILFYDDIQFNNDRLQIPHKLMLEREFVLRPLCQILKKTSNHSFPQGYHPESLSKNLVDLQKNSNNPPISTFTPLSPSLSLRPLSPSRPTHIMSILNLTPDSFSDGGVHSSSDLTYLRNTLLAHLDSGATILDLGGQSTRPRAPQINPSKELSRILPALATLRSLPESQIDGKAISIDTYRASVAREAVKRGAHIINDVSAGTLDPDMLPTVAELGVSVVLMHMRGTPETMTSLTTYEGDLITAIGNELLDRVRAAEKAGIRRWRIILDPGIGFAKNAAQNLELLRRMRELRDFPGLEGLPWLVATSRKGFIGTLTGVKKAEERGWGTAAAVTAAVQGGADVVRVHDVGEMGMVVKVADAVWRV
ncbi:folic acid synthesis protein-like protein [Aulographum hederae CBS 113979]|uniref:Folic acid synthesis protein FOL1 n=1 Tax=Aulographum hederae CBS 113979 TaxID=1176131 RepID=A0A6G1H2U4_9PEZI|nr:folic acid synthesis protein-like protein [Aulographum hederae CBS 113979]